MADVSDSQLRTYAKSSDFKEGEEIEFIDSGAWTEMDFSPAKDGTRIKKVFKTNIRMPNGDVKEFTVNATSLKSLGNGWGTDTNEWVRKTAKVSFIKQLSFGKVTNVLVLLPQE